MPLLLLDILASSPVHISDGLDPCLVPRSFASFCSHPNIPFQAHLSVCALERLLDLIVLQILPLEVVTLWGFSFGRDSFAVCWFRRLCCLLLCPGGLEYCLESVIIPCHLDARQAILIANA
jgi:hypothetical protein